MKDEKQLSWDSLAALGARQELAVGAPAAPDDASPTPGQAAFSEPAGDVADGLTDGLVDDSRLAERVAELGRDPRASRLAGAILGAAIGDAMGHPTEFLSLAEIRRRYGEAGVTGYELYWEREGERFAPYTDDTQMAEVVLRCLLRSVKDNLDLDATMGEIAAGFIAWSHQPQGGTAHQEMPAWRVVAPSKVAFTGRWQAAKRRAAAVP